VRKGAPGRRKPNRICTRGGRTPDRLWGALRGAGEKFGPGKQHRQLLGRHSRKKGKGRRKCTIFQTSRAEGGSRAEAGRVSSEALRRLKDNGQTKPKKERGRGKTGTPSEKKKRHRTIRAVVNEQSTRETR